MDAGWLECLSRAGMCEIIVQQNGFAPIDHIPRNYFTVLHDWNLVYKTEIMMIDGGDGFPSSIQQAKNSGVGTDQLATCTQNIIQHHREIKRAADHLQNAIQPLFPLQQFAGFSK